MILQSYLKPSLLSKDGDFRVYSVNAIKFLHYYGSKFEMLEEKDVADTIEAVWACLQCVTLHPTTPTDAQNVRSLLYHIIKKAIKKVHLKSGQWPHNLYLINIQGGGW